MRSLLRLLKPDNFEDISAVIALYRPGPMGANSHINYALRKNGQQEITPIHEEFKESLAEILDTSYGLIIYQEQVMAIAQKVAGFSARTGRHPPPRDGQEEEVRARQAVRGLPGGHARERATRDDAVQTLWEILLPFSDYAFNKAHSAAYGLVSYWTAYLKAHYPAEYMAALLTSVGDSKDKMAVYLNECRRMGIKVLPPDVGRVDPVLRGGRGRHPLRARRRAQRRRECRRRHRRGTQGCDVLVVPRLPGQGPDARGEQAHRRVAHQGRCVRLLGVDAACSARDP